MMTKWDLETGSILWRLLEMVQLTAVKLPGHAIEDLGIEIQNSSLVAGCTISPIDRR